APRPATSQSAPARNRGTAMAPSPPTQGEFQEQFLAAVQEFVGGVGPREILRSRRFAGRARAPSAVMLRQLLVEHDGRRGRSPHCQNSYSTPALALNRRSSPSRATRRRSGRPPPAAKSSQAVRSALPRPGGQYALGRPIVSQSSLSRRPNSPA